MHGEIGRPTPATPEPPAVSGNPARRPRQNGFRFLPAPLAALAAALSLSPSQSSATHTGRPRRLFRENPTPGKPGKRPLFQHGYEGVWHSPRSLCLAVDAGGPGVAVS